MNALRAIHAALVPGGLVIDTQPVSAQPPIEGEAGALGTLDMREWAALIDEIDRRVGDAVASGLFVVVHESRLTVTDAYDDGDDFLANVRDWVGTRVDPEGRCASAASADGSVCIRRSACACCARPSPVSAGP